MRHSKLGEGVLWYIKPLIITGNIGVFMILLSCFAGDVPSKNNATTIYKTDSIPPQNSYYFELQRLDSLLTVYQEKNDNLDIILRNNNFVIDCKPVIDSLQQKLELLSSEKILLSNLLLSNRLLKEMLRDTLREYCKLVNDLFAVAGNRAERILYNDEYYDCYLFDPRLHDLKLYWQDNTGHTIGRLGNLSKVKKKEGELLVFATNAGMYTPEQAPQGLFIEEGDIKNPIDLKKEAYGNFYMQPNGIFIIDSLGMGLVMTTDSFQGHQNSQIAYATQSGPMLVIDGMMNNKFNESSTSKYIRSGVGVLPDQRLVFVISNRPVNFFSFASVFKDYYHCRNALYLDGAISKMWLPELGRFQDDGRFGPIIGFSKKVD